MSVAASANAPPPSYRAHQPRPMSPKDIDDPSSPTAPSARSRGSADRDAEALHRVVAVTLEVPWRVERLGVASPIRRAARQLVIADDGVPHERPGTPGELSAGGAKRRVLP